MKITNSKDEKYEQRAALGVCQTHITRQAVPGKRKCQECADLKKIYDANRLAMAKEKGLCYRCLVNPPRMGGGNCIDCNRKALNRSYIDRYGITKHDYEEMVQKQKGKCAVCYRERKLHVDHNHKTGRVRKLLCGLCNRALGMLEENLSIILSLFNYVEKENAENDKEVQHRPQLSALPDPGNG